MHTIFRMAIIGVLLCSCHKPEKSPIMTLEVPVTYPKVTNITRSYSYPAALRAIREAKLVARVPGFLKQINYAPGSTVESGSLLFLIEPYSYQFQSEVAEAAVTTAKANLEFAKSNYERMQKSATTKAVSDIDFLQAKSSFMQAQAVVAQAIAQQNEANLNLSYCYVKAPFTGRISKNILDVGNYLTGGGETLASIFDESYLYADFSMTYANFTTLNKPYDSIKPLIVLNNDTIHGTMNYIAPNVNLQTGTIAARGLLENGSGKLLSGVYATIIIPYEQNSKAIIIPENCVGTTQDIQFVYTLAADSTVQMSQVQTGDLLDNGMIEILSGLSESDLYLVNALAGVRPGEKIKPILTH